MENHLKVATVLAHGLDNQFTLFGKRFGLSSLIGLIPEVGDLVAAGLSLYLVWVAIKMQLPKLKILEMLGNILINFLIGLVPILGDAVYFLRKPNIKNLKILNDYAKRSSTDGKVLQPVQYASAH